MSENSSSLYLIAAVLTGALIPIQAATNAAFSKSTGSPSVTGLMVFIVGLVVMVLFVAFSKTQVPAVSALKAAPIYSYLGGAIVAIYVIMITLLTPKIGVGKAIGLIVTGQIIAAVIIDHFGLFQTAVRAITIERLIGVLLMIAGIFLVMRRTSGS